MLFLLASLLALDPIVIVEGQERTPVSPAMEILVDPTAALSLEQVTSTAYASAFTPSEGASPSFGFTTAAYWIRFRVRHAQATPGSWILHMPFAPMQDIRLYTLLGDSLVATQQGGRRVPFASRELTHPDHVFPLHLPPGTEVTYYARFVTSSSMQLPLVLWKADAFLARDAHRQLGLGLYFGILLVMLFYNLFIFFSLRHRRYFFYVLYLSVLIPTMLSLRGLDVVYLWPDAPWWASRAIPFFSAATMVTIVQFTQVFLATHRQAPRVHRALDVLKYAGLTLACLFFLNASILLPLVAAHAVFSSAFVLITSIVIWRDGYRPARYFTLAWGIFLTGLIAFALQRLGLLPTVWITEYGIQWGSAIEVTLLSMALADWINILKEEATQAQHQVLEIQQAATLRLEEKVAERTRALEDANHRLSEKIAERREAQEQLQAYTEALNEKNVELEQFAYLASHDLQEPLRTITSYLKLLRDQYEGRFDEEADHFIAFVLGATERMRQLIQGLLAYSRTSNQELTLSRIDLMGILSQIQQDLHSALTDTQAELAVDPLPTVLGDGTMLRQLLQNLVSNALKFRRDVPPEIRITATRTEHLWQISVRDNGIGIKPRHHQRIFEIFKRLHGRSKYKGTGIGLALCRKIVTRHGGEIWVESTYGEGTTFFFTLQAA